jgi:hypothetical protein
MGLKDDNTKPGVNPVLHSFDLAYYGGGTLAEVGVYSWNGTTSTLTALWSTTNVAIPAGGHVTFDFGGVPLEGTEDSMWISYTTQTEEAVSYVAMDNVIFSQSQLGDPTQHTVTGISPTMIPDNSADALLTIEGTFLDGTTATLVQGATVINVDGSGLSVSGDGSSITGTFLTSGAAGGWYDVVVSKAGVSDVTLEDALFIRTAGINLLLNGDFETGDKSGWIDWGGGWGGDIDNRIVSDTEWLYTPEIDTVPTPAFDTYSFRCGEQDNLGGDAGIRQVVDVVPGETLLLSFQWGGGSMDDKSLHQVGVVANAQTGDGAAGFNTWLASASMGTDDVSGDGLVVGEWGWEQRELLVQVPQDVDQITVYVRTWHQPDGSNFPDGHQIATWTDNMSLTVAPVCANQHEPTDVSPNAWDVGTPLDLTVHGTNMDQVTGVRLKQGQIEYEGQIISSTSGSVTAQFTPPTTGARQGDYDVVTEQAGCQPRLLAAAFSYICDKSLTDVTPTTLQKPQGVVQMTINGSNLDHAGTIKLVWDRELRETPHPATGELTIYWMPLVEIPGTVIDDSNPDSVIVEFDLDGAPVGFYHLVVDWQEAYCASTQLAKVFELTLPEGVELLTNGSFETGAFDPWVAVPEGETDFDEPMPGPLVEASPWADGFGFMAPDGSYLAGTRASSLGEGDMFTPNGGTITQTLPDLPSGPGHYDLTLVFWVRMFDQIPGGSGGPTRTVGEIVIDEGTAQETISSITAAFPEEYDQMSRDEGDGFVRLSVDFSGEVWSSIAVRFFTMADCALNYGHPTVIGIDNVQLIGPDMICNEPFADTDADGDVDQSDFAVLQQCYSGSGNSYPEDLPYCRCLDRPETGNPQQPDGDIDMNDVSAFEACASGPGVAADVNCDGS